jgi:hypothetical protein
MHRTEGNTAMKTIAAFFAMLALLVLSYSIRRIRSQSEVVHADQAPSPRWTKVEIPLTVSHYDKLGLAYAQGFWQSTSLSKDKQLVSPIAVKIECNNSDKTCRESEASVFLGVLQADLSEYDITSWTPNGIVADDTDEGNCGIGHRLSLDFKSNSVTVTDYPKKVSTDKNCQPFQDADSYSLHGGQLTLYPPAPWDPLAKAEGSK